MVRNLLRFLPGYHALVVELEQVRESLRLTEQEKLRLDDRLQEATADRARLWDTLQESLREERKAYQAHVNLSWQRLGAGAPYPEQPHVPERQAHTEAYGRGGRQLPSEMVRKRTAEFVNGIFKTAGGE